jgi:hypothetical protein
VAVQVVWAMLTQQSELMVVLAVVVQETTL